MTESSYLNPLTLPKYKQILEKLSASIHLGEYRAGDRLPSETDLCGRFGVSRLTIQRALKELQISGMVDRKAGSGTYVSARKPPESYLFGLLIPGLGQTEIFEPVCQGMARAGRKGGHGLLWGDTSHEAAEQASQARQLCTDYIGRKVSGVFFAPIEGVPGKDEVNITIAERLAQAGIPLVLLDRCIYDYPQRSRFDLVGIDNRRAGYRMAQYLIDCGSRRPAFLGRANMAPTVSARVGGFRDACLDNGCPSDRVTLGNPDSIDEIRELMNVFNPDGIVCANDTSAVSLMRNLDILGVPVPEQVRIVGIDDVRYASHLRIPLTTLHQPCQMIGEAALQAMLSRIAQPNLPARDILLDCKLVVRQSCGKR